MNTDGFYTLAIVNNAAINMGVQGSFQVSVFFSSDKWPEVELLDHMVVIFVTFWENSILFSIVTAPIYISTNGAQMFPFLYILTNTCYFLSFL